MQINAGPTACRQCYRKCGICGMNEQFQALPMTWAGARAAYPLVYLYDASVTLNAWLNFVRRQIRTAPARGGLMAIRDRRGTVHAVFSYRVDRDLRARKRLCLVNLIVAHLPGSPIDDALIASTSKIAATLNCQTICIAQPFQPSPDSTRHSAMSGSRDGQSRLSTSRH